MSRDRTRPLVLLCMAALLSAACGASAPVATPRGTAAASPSGASDPSDAASPGGTVAPGAGTSDACGLITVQEAASATGVGVTAANGSVAGPSSSCLYVGDGGASLVISSSLLVAAGIDQYLNDPANEQVPGIGDKAVIFQAAGTGLPTGRTIYVRKGDKGFVLNVHVEDLDDAAARTILIELATLATGRT